MSMLISANLRLGFLPLLREQARQFLQQSFGCFAADESSVHSTSLPVLRSCLLFLRFREKVNKLKVPNKIVEVYFVRRARPEAWRSISAVEVT
jgi:hypothetical protein